MVLDSQHAPFGMSFQKLAKSAANHEAWLVISGAPARRGATARGPAIKSPVAAVGRGQRVVRSRFFGSHTNGHTATGLRVVVGRRVVI